MNMIILRNCVFGNVIKLIRYNSRLKCAINPITGVLVGFKRFKDTEEAQGRRPVKKEAD